MIMNHFIEYVRIRALENGVRETHTLYRIKALVDLSILKESDASDLTRAYQTLMNLRLQRQEELILKGEEGSNYLNPDNLSSLELKVFKASLFLTQDIHLRLRVEYPQSPSL
tara:strand:+ start:125 stop:460 length:336 start_codon:yes stop_codon:yes gene_type:complete